MTLTTRAASCLDPLSAGLACRAYAKLGRRGPCGQVRRDRTAYGRGAARGTRLQGAPDADRPGLGWWTASEAYSPLQTLAASQRRSCSNHSSRPLSKPPRGALPNFLSAPTCPNAEYTARRASCWICKTRRL